MPPVRVRKPLEFLSSSKGDLSEFPDDAKLQIGHALRLLQDGLQPDAGMVSSMSDVGQGVMEVRCHYVGQQGEDYRAFYVAKFPEALYVLHAFEKKSQNTAPRDLRTGRERYKRLTAWRESQGFTEKQNRRRRR